MYQALLDEINNEIETDKVHEKIDKLAMEIFKEAPPIEIKEEKKLKYIEYQEKINLLKNNMAENINNVIWPGNEDFGPVSITTISLKGTISGLKFNEEELIKKAELTPNPSIPYIECNFGQKNIDSYIIPNKLKKSNRGRKKKEKKKKPRKLQGSGKCFNTQITFIASYCDCCEKQEFKGPIFRSTNVFDGPNSYGVLTVPLNPGDHLTNCVINRLKYKVFRNGKIILSGAKPKNMKYILQSINDIIYLFGTSLGVDPRALKLESLCPTMKNYKYFIDLDVGQSIDFKELEKVFVEEKNRVIDINNIFDRARPPAPIISNAQAHIENNNFSVKFKTPNINDPTKMVRVNFFQKNKNSSLAKINILGAIDDEVTCQIVTYIDYIFTEYRYCVINKWEPKKFKLPEIPLLPILNNGNKPEL